MKDSKIINAIYAIIIITAHISCERLVDVDLPKNEITTEKVFTDSASADAAIAGIYIAMMQSFSISYSSGAITTYTGLSSDELYQSINDQNSQFYNHSILTTNSTISTLWSAAYRYIYAANACIEGIENSNNLSASQKAKFIGEAKLLRAFLYFNLVNLYGGVPLVLTTDYETNRLKNRSSENELYLQLIDDLTLAKSSLPRVADLNYRGTELVASALLARLYLWTRNYEAAKEEASNVINSGAYELATEPNEVFLSESSETIWCFLPVYPGRATWEGYYFIPTSSTNVPRTIVAEGLIEGFEPDDLRKESWINTNTVNSIDYPYPYKYKMNTSTSGIGERYVVLRLAEQYLIRSEAEAYLGNVSSGEADLNIIRERAGLPTLSGIDQNALLGAIENERRFELMFEWGHRWFDLKRTNRVDDVLSLIKPNWSAASVLYPIPQTEIDRNPNLTQNDGY